MDVHEVELIRRALEETRETLRTEDSTARDAARPVALDQSSVGRLSRMDAMQGQAMAIEARRRRQVQLTRVNAALRRIETGDYGRCHGCDEEIDPRRLAFDPTVTLCIGCASSQA